MMRITTRLAELSFWFGLVFWVSAIMTAGVSAAMAFPTMREYAVVVPRFAAFDQSEHWSIAAGLLMERMFFVTDIGQLVAALFVIIGLGAGYITRGRRVREPMEMLRTVCVAGAALLLAYRVFILAPSMNGSLQRYWHAAEQGSAEVAAKQRGDFQESHPVATRIYGLTLVLLLGALGATAWTPATGSRPPTGREPEEPQLVRNLRR